MLARVLLVPQTPTTVILNEVMASNGSVIADDDGEFEDWIELYNPTAHPIGLGDYALSDRPGGAEGWALPDVEIGAGEHLIVWASGKRHWFLPGRRVDNPVELGFVSAGGRDGNDLELRLNGENVAGPEPGLHLAQVDREGRLVATTAFETHLGHGASDRLVAALRAVPDGQVMMLGIRGNGAAYLSDQAVTVLVDELGSSYATRLDPDDSWGLVAVKGGNVLAEDYRALTQGRATGRARSSGELHAGFRLRRSGDFLGLYDDADTLIDSAAIGPLTRNSSWGRHRDGMSDWCHYAVPTPGAPNAPFCTPKIDAPVASLAGGYYGEPIVISLGNPRVTEVRFTLDGSTPSQASEQYVEPIELDQTTVLRARAYREGFNPSEVVSYTYFIDEIDDTVLLPVVSLITDPANLWDRQRGIYVEGTDPASPNYERRGMAWERPVTMELYEEAGAVAFTVEAGLRVMGGSSREFPKKNFVINFRPRYGDDVPTYPLFQSTERQRFESLVLRMGGDDGEADQPRLRDPLMHTLWGEVGGVVSATRPVFLYLNGRPWGIYNLRERIDVDYLTAHYGHNDVDLIRESDQVRAGDLVHWNETFAFFEEADLDRPEDLAHAERLVDLDNFIDFYWFQIYAGNIDLVEANLIKYRPRTPDGRWRWIMWDVDVSFGYTSASPVTHDTLAWFTRDTARPDLGFWDDDGGDSVWSTVMLRKLLAAETTRARVLTRWADLLNTTLSEASVVELIDAAAGAIDADIPYDLEVWADEWGGSHEGWRDNVDVLRDFARGRPNVLRALVAQRFGLTDAVLEVVQPSSGWGRIRVNSIEVDEYPWTGHYFREIPVTLEALPANGVVFAGWADASWPQTPVVTVTLDDLRTVVGARFTRPTS